MTLTLVCLNFRAALYPSFCGAYLVETVQDLGRKGREQRFVAVRKKKARKDSQGPEEMAPNHGFWNVSGGVHVI
jgi:hypothetical protein